MLKKSFVFQIEREKGVRIMTAITGLNRRI